MKKTYTVFENISSTTVKATSYKKAVLEVVGKHVEVETKYAPVAGVMFWRVVGSENWNTVQVN